MRKHAASPAMRRRMPPAAPPIAGIALEVEVEAPCGGVEDEVEIGASPLVYVCIAIN
jgi:hypothetical protein